MNESKENTDIDTQKHDNENDGETLLKKEIILTEIQFLDIWDYGRYSRHSYPQMRKKLEYYKTQFPDKFFDGKHEIIYCLSLIEWIDIREHLKLENNDLYQATLRKVSLEKYRSMSRQGFYDYKDIMELMGLNRNAAQSFIMSNKDRIKIDNQYFLPKALLDQRLKLKQFYKNKVEIEDKVKIAIVEHQRKIRIINTIDNEKLKLIKDQQIDYNIFIKMCQNDCFKGQSGDCEFYNNRDTEGMRSTCIYLRLHAVKMIESIKSYFEESDDTFKNFTKRQQVRHLLEAELALKYRYLQMPYIDTVIVKKDGTQIICEYESKLIKDSAVLSERWQELGLNPPELKAGKKELKEMVGTDGWNDAMTEHGED